MLRGENDSSQSDEIQANDLGNGDLNVDRDGDDVSIAMMVLVTAMETALVIAKNLVMAMERAVMELVMVMARRL